MVRFRRLRGMALVGSVLFAVAALPVRAQAAAPATSAPAATVSAEDLQHLVDTIQDPTERQRLVKTLQALIAAQHAEPVQPSPAGFVETLTAQIDAITGEILTAAQVVVDAPRLANWIQSQIGDRDARDFWFSVAVRLIVIFGVGFTVDRAIYLLLRTPARRIESEPGSRAWTQISLLLLCFVIEALPAVAFAVAATLAVPFTHAIYGTEQVAATLINAILWSRIVLAAARVALLAPSAVALYPLGGETRHYLYIWMRRFTGWAVYGYAVASGAWWLGVPGAIYALLLRGATLVLATLAIIFVLQNRKTVADWLRGNGHGVAGWRLLRQRLADTWHVLAIIYVVGSFGTFLLNVQGGFLFLLQATASTVVVLLAAALLVRGIERLTRRGFAVSPEQQLRYPTLEARANRYLPVVYYVAASVIYFFSALAILQAWGVNAFGWLGTEAGRSAAGTIVTIVLVIVAALVAWEFFSSAIERYLHTTDGVGSPVARSARARTLLPLLRTTVLVVVIVLVGLVVLSQVGINIAPLLAGAGVVGLAVGFGSQALVKDVINGLFILVEDTLAVGDVVDVGNDHAGVVEAISIRAIRLRDMAGTVHTVPFSEVTTVKNLTKDFSYYVADVGVSYREDTDEVVKVLRHVADEMRSDPAFKPLMLEPMEVVGVDRFEDSAVIIKIRLKTPPIQQWTVGREFNRRIKKAFDEHGIEMPFPHRTLYFGASRQGDAPPVHIALDQPPPEKPAD